ncbi:iron transporter [Halorussus halophilus]|uniref:iron transporter n=1 Tax=Halorussus halophilus TaxID=2650975 RepID=UPI0013015DE8|nr:iron transporter [Halorussus halophilus]
MQRRDFLRATSVAGIAGLAGCTGMFETQSARSAGQGSFTTVANRKNAVYYPTHKDEMTMLGMGGKGRYKVGLMYSLPHTFWNISGRNTNRAKVGEEVTAHFMATIWDKQTETVLPTANVSAELLKDGETVDSRQLWPMLSQNMGYHFGDNVNLDGDGKYTAKLDIGAMQAKRMGELQGAFGEGTTLEVEFDHSRKKLGDLGYTNLPDKQGKAGAISPMDMKMPISQLPTKKDLPATGLAAGASGDAKFLAFTTEENPHFVADGKSYLGVSARTPYNRYPLPFMGLAATLKRDGETVFDGDFSTAMDPELGYHYGVGVDSLKSGDQLTLTVNAPPQVARHEGYETAFLQMSKMEMELA